MDGWKIPIDAGEPHFSSSAAICGFEEGRAVMINDPLTFPLVPQGGSVKCPYIWFVTKYLQTWITIKPQLCIAS